MIEDILLILLGGQLREVLCQFLLSLLGKTPLPLTLRGSPSEHALGIIMTIHEVRVTEAICRSWLWLLRLLLLLEVHVVVGRIECLILFVL